LSSFNVAAFFRFFRRFLCASSTPSASQRYLRLLNAEDRIAAKDPENFRIDWTDVPRPDRDRALIRANSQSWTPPIPPVPA